MIKKGIQVTCTGCGINSFVDEYDAKVMGCKSFSLKDGAHSKAYNENQSESWYHTVQKMDLCPRCHAIYEKMLCRFYEECGEARDKGES